LHESTPLEKALKGGAVALSDSVPFYVKPRSIAGNVSADAPQPKRAPSNLLAIKPKASTVRKWLMALCIVCLCFSMFLLGLYVGVTGRPDSAPKKTVLSAGQKKKGAHVKDIKKLPQKTEDALQKIAKIPNTTGKPDKIDSNKTKQIKNWVLRFGTFSTEDLGKELVERLSKRGVQVKCVQGKDDQGAPVFFVQTSSYKSWEGVQTAALFFESQHSLSTTIALLDNKEKAS
jgi:cell division septation protein DedD